MVSMRLKVLTVVRLIGPTGPLRPSTDIHPIWFDVHMNEFTYEGGRYGWVRMTLSQLSGLRYSVRWTNHLTFVIGHLSFMNLVRCQ